MKTWGLALTVKRNRFSSPLLKFAVIPKPRFVHHQTKLHRIKPSKNLASNDRFHGIFVLGSNSLGECFS
jgi:hypothetical protein